MKTTDGYTISPLEQQGQYTGEDRGRLWLVQRGLTRWYGGFLTREDRDAAMVRAQTMTARAFDTWFDTAVEVLKIHGRPVKGS
jgi:hypothetical protein